MAANGEDHEGRLDGWEEIAAHLNVSASTVKRWYCCCGMPVYRWPGSQRVCAYNGELDQWYSREIRRGALPGQGSNG